MGATNLKQALALAAGVEVGTSAATRGLPPARSPKFWGLREFDAFRLSSTTFLRCVQSRARLTQHARDVERALRCCAAQRR